jgi:predicted dehydrogenase
MAFIGTGNVARLHAEAVSRLDAVRFVGAWSRSEEKVRTFSAAFGIRAYRSREELLADDAVDAVVVLTSADSHYEAALESLRAGKHVLVEKPVAGSLAELESLKQATRAANRLCVPIHNYVYDPRLREVKRRLNAGDFGRLSSFWLIYNQKHVADTKMSKETLFHELMVHHAYAAIYFGGPPLRLATSASNIHFSDPSLVDQIMCVVEHEGGVISNLWGSMGVDDFTSSPWTVFYKLLGTNGGFEASWNDMRVGEAKLPGWDRPAYRDSFYHVHEYFVRKCLERGKPPLSTLDDAILALRMTQAMVLSVKTGRKIDVNASGDPFRD